MKQALDLNNLGLAPMNEFEMQEVDGGSFIGVVKAMLALTVMMIRTAN